jgi:hypothetical protein
VSPDWAIAAFHALVRPKPWRREAIEHRNGEQAWPAEGERVVGEIAGEFGRRFGEAMAVHTGAAGDFHFVVEVDARAGEVAKALGVVLSKRLGVWVQVGKVYVHGGKFYRTRGRNIRRLVVAKDVHVQREVRAVVRDLMG